MAKNRFGQFTPDGNGKVTYEYFVTTFLEKINSGEIQLNTLTQQMLSVLQQDKEVEVFLVRCTHSDNSTEVLKQVTDYKATPITNKYYKADGTEYTLLPTDTLEYIDNKQMLLDILAAIQDAGGAQFNISSSVATGSGTIPVNYGGSVYNKGNADATFNGVQVGPGMSISWENGEFGTISYDATGTSLLICYKYK